ncbi:tctex1 domain-containing protein 1-like [Pollicipes pollicipes]|uniref:tctex1 domain-containing protein 1-like n=1 Tax=Pollicipes pollicipes TaxID=41117 RepID=UPI0018855FC1|nr:tctex1 domain-containing protein 1-like [Pollicipes pollicipes]
MVKHRVENTYCLEPPERFQVLRVRELVERRLAETLQGVQYDPERCRGLAVTLADFIRKDIMDEGLLSTRDNFATATYENQSLVAVATIFALYYE